MTLGQEFSEIAAKTDELRKELGVSEKDDFTRDLMQMMVRASYDGDMSLPVDLRIALVITKLFDGTELPRLVQRIQDERN